MKDYGGVVPEIASREHLKVLPLAIHKALTDAALTTDALDGIAATNRPGLIGALLVGLSTAKAMAFALQKPFLAIHHVEAHLFSPLLSATESNPAPPFPWIGLVVSGGHTELYYVEGIHKITLLGTTLDDAAGEAFDKIGKLLGLPYPAGPQIDRLVQSRATPEHAERFLFPIPRTEKFHFSFSGLKTAVFLKLKTMPTLSVDDRLAILASSQEAIVNQLVRQTSQAEQQYPSAKLVLSGGVACNSRLRSKLLHAFFPEPKHCTDNAAMVALLAALKWKVDPLLRSGLDVTADSRGEI